MVELTSQQAPGTDVLAYGLRNLKRPWEGRLLPSLLRDQLPQSLPDRLQVHGGVCLLCGHQTVSNARWEDPKDCPCVHWSVKLLKALLANYLT